MIQNKTMGLFSRILNLSIVPNHFIAKHIAKVWRRLILSTALFITTACSSAFAQVSDKYEDPVSDTHWTWVSTKCRSLDAAREWQEQGVNSLIYRKYRFLYFGNGKMTASDSYVDMEQTMFHKTYGNYIRTVLPRGSHLQNYVKVDVSMDVMRDAKTVLDSYDKMDADSKNPNSQPSYPDVVIQKPGPVSTMLFRKFEEKGVTYLSYTERIKDNPKFLDILLHMPNYFKWCDASGQVEYFYMKVSRAK